MARTGRPTSINQVVDHIERRDPDTDAVLERVPVTAGERVVQLVRAGNYIETAAAAAGISKDTFHGWLRRSAEAHGKLHRKEHLTALDRACMEFSAAVDDAQAAAEAEDVSRLQGLGRARRVTTVTVQLAADGTEVSRSQQTKELGPDPAVLMWRLERRFRPRWGRQVQVDGQVELGGELDLSASAKAALGDLVAEVADRLAAVAVVGAGAEADLATMEERPGLQPPDGAGTEPPEL